jgi:hypothetical protein
MKASWPSNGRRSTGHVGAPPRGGRSSPARGKPAKRAMFFRIEISGARMGREMLDPAVDTSSCQLLRQVTSYLVRIGSPIRTTTNARFVNAVRPSPAYYTDFSGVSWKMPSLVAVQRRDWPDHPPRTGRHRTRLHPGPNLPSTTNDRCWLAGSSSFFRSGAPNSIRCRACPSHRQEPNATLRACR